MDGLTRMPTVEEITYAVSVAAGVDPAELPGKRKTNRMTIARFAWWRMLRKHTDMSYDEIGEVANRDHGSVMCGVGLKFCTEERNRRVEEIVRMADGVLSRITVAGMVGPVVTKQTVDGLSETMDKAKQRGVA